MVKILRESMNKPERTGMIYLNAVEESIRHLHEYHTQAGRALKECDLTHACKEGLGPTWTYDRGLDCCVDERFAVGNRSLRREGDQIIFREDDWQNITQPSVNVNTNSIGDPNFRGTWGTPIDADSKLHDYTQSSGNTTVQMGNSLGDYQMQSGYEIAKRRPFEWFDEQQKVKKIKLNV